MSIMPKQSLNAGKARCTRQNQAMSPFNTIQHNSLPFIAFHRQLALLVILFMQSPGTYRSLPREADPLYQPCVGIQHYSTQSITFIAFHRNWLCLVFTL
jgi:hypothetical protein